MNCEEFDLAGAGFTLEDAATRQAALEHVSHCSRCAALQESWQAARVELGVLASETRQAEAPARVEMRLRQEFRTKYRTAPARRAAALAAWMLATAALLFCVVSVRNWRHGGQTETANRQRQPTQSTLRPAKEITAPVAEPGDGRPSSAALVVSDRSAKRVSRQKFAADNDTGEFTWLPGSVPMELEEAAIVRVRMQRGALGALGLPVNEERAGEWIQVDMLVGNDGLPQAVKLNR